MFQCSISSQHVWPPIREVELSSHVPRQTCPHWFSPSVLLSARLPPFLLLFPAWINSSYFPITLRVWCFPPLVQVLFAAGSESTARIFSCNNDREELTLYVFAETAGPPQCYSLPSSNNCHRGRHAGYVMDLWNFSSVSWNVPLYIVCLPPASKCEWFVQSRRQRASECLVLALPGAAPLPSCLTTCGSLSHVHYLQWVLLHFLCFARCQFRWRVCDMSSRKRDGRRPKWSKTSKTGHF